MDRLPHELGAVVAEGAEEIRGTLSRIGHIVRGENFLGTPGWPHDNFTRFVGQWKDQTAFNISEHALH